MTTVSETLHKAADLIEKRGWAQGAGWGEGEGAALCLEGGLIAALGLDVIDRSDPSCWFINQQYDQFVRCPAYQAVKNYLGDEVKASLFCWNDKSERTASEVIEVLRAAAVIEAAKDAAAEKVEVPA